MKNHPIKGIRGIRGLRSEIVNDKIRYTRAASLSFPDMVKHANYFPTILTVGIYGGEQFRTIANALTSIKDSASNKWYLVMLSGGTFNENITIPPYVVLKGNHAAQITGTITISGNAVLDSVKVNATTAISIPGDIQLDLWDCDITGAWNVTDSTITCHQLAGVGDLTFQGDSYVHIWDSELVSTMTKTDAGIWNVGIYYSRIVGRIYAVNATSQLIITNTAIWRLTPGAAIELEAGIANSYVRMRYSTLQTQAGGNTIEVSGGIGNLDVWTAFNALAGWYGAQVNENIAIPYNLIDAGFTL